MYFGLVSEIILTLASNKHYSLTINYHHFGSTKQKRLWGLVREGGGGLWWGLFGEGEGEGEWLGDYLGLLGGNFDGRLFGRGGGELWGIILGWTQVGRGRSDETENDSEKKEIRKVQLFTKTIPSGLRVKFNNVILDNTDIINCHKTITTYEQTDG